MDKKEEMRYKSKMELMAFLFFCGGVIAGGMIEKVDTINKQKEAYIQTTDVEQEGNLYQLTNGNHIYYCRLENDVYYDIYQKDMIAIAGYEEELGYSVTPLISSMPTTLGETDIHKVIEKISHK